MSAKTHMNWASSGALTLAAARQPLTELGFGLVHGAVGLVDRDLVEADRAAVGVEPAHHAVAGRPGRSRRSSSRSCCTPCACPASSLLYRLPVHEVRAHDVLVVVDRPDALAGALVDDPLARALPGVGRQRRSIVAGGRHRRELETHRVLGARGRRRRVDDERVVAGPDAEQRRRAAADDAVDVEAGRLLERGGGRRRAPG